MRTRRAWLPAALLASALLASGTGTSAAAAPFIDNGDGTVTDTQTHLTWEKKTASGASAVCDELVDCPDPHEVNQFYDWSRDGAPPTGMVFANFLGRLNGAYDGVCFAGHCDWRLPTDEELHSILLPIFCFRMSCIDAIFGPTGSVYWSGTTDATVSSARTTSFYPDFGDLGRVPAAPKSFTLAARAVRAHWPCDDGIDNDGDGLVDHPDDPGCASAGDLDELDPDADGDGVSDAQDDCTLVADPSQLDTDGDGIGNACDPDYDQNGAVGISDFDHLRSQFGKRSGTDPDFDPDADHDGDGAVGLADFNVLRAFFGSPPGPAAPPAADDARFVDNGDGTITDTETHLTWEKKTGTAFGGSVVCDDLVDCADPHDVNNYYDWSGDGEPPTGMVFANFLGRLNGAYDGVCFAGHCDWRLPTEEELRSILLPISCFRFSCIDAIFGPTDSVYWSGTTDATVSSARTASFFPDFSDFGLVPAAPKWFALAARAVRDAR